MASPKKGNLLNFFQKTPKSPSAARKSENSPALATSAFKTEKQPLAADKKTERTLFDDDEAEHDESGDRQQQAAAIREKSNPSDALEDGGGDEHTSTPTGGVVVAQLTADRTSGEVGSTGPVGDDDENTSEEDSAVTRKRRRIASLMNYDSSPKSSSSAEAPVKHAAAPEKRRRVAGEPSAGAEHSKNIIEGENEELKKTVQDAEKDNDDVDDDHIEPPDNDAESDVVDGIKRVSADSAAGKAALAKLMQAATAMAAGGGGTTVGTKKKGPNTGSLFGQTTVTPDTAPSAADISDPAFDPGALDGAVLRPTPKKGAAAAPPSSLLFALLVEAFDRIEAIKGSGQGSKKSCTVVLANTYRILLKHQPTDLVPAVYICLNRVAPDYEGVEVGVGDGILMKSMSEVYSRSEAAIKADMAQCEDLGVVAAASKCSVRTLVQPPRLTIQHVFNEMKSLPAATGQQSQTRKRDKIKKLLVAAKDNEPKYIVRFLQQKLRIGVQLATVYQALAYAFILSPRKDNPGGSDDDKMSFVSDVRRVRKIPPADLESMLTEMELAVAAAHCEHPNIENIINHLLEGVTAAGLPKLCSVTPGTPVKAMLAKPTKGLSEVLTRFADCKFTCEFKYDGERAQIHKLTGGNVRVFSRNLEELTGKYPDVTAVAVDALSNVSDCILDSEVVAYDESTEKILPFQVLQGRKRKDVSSEDVKIRVCIFAFDCIRMNGVNLIKEALATRRQHLYEAVTEIPTKFTFAKHAEIDTLEDIDTFLQDAIDANCEGLMVKTLESNASYEPSKRSLNWLKVKKDYVQGMSDSVDLVPIGAYMGRGKRSKFYGTYLLAVWNPVNETYQTVCKLGTGFSDEDLQQHYEFLGNHKASFKPRDFEVSDKLTPDVWFNPVQVWECKAADLSISPVHSAATGSVHPEKGIGLRFPRFLRIREDKKPQDATCDSQILEMYNEQFSGTAATKVKELVGDMEDEWDEYAD